MRNQRKESSRSEGFHQYTGLVLAVMINLVEEAYSSHLCDDGGAQGPQYGAPGPPSLYLGQPRAPHMGPRNPPLGPRDPIWVTYQKKNVRGSAAKSFFRLLSTRGPMGPATKNWGLRAPQKKTYKKWYCVMKDALSSHKTQSSHLTQDLI